MGVEKSSSVFVRDRKRPLDRCKLRVDEMGSIEVESKPGIKDNVGRKEGGR